MTLPCGLSLVTNSRYVWFVLSARAQTVPELKELCTRFQLPKTGKKQDLIGSLARHLGYVFDGGGGAGAGVPGRSRI